jgi:hypothetical protein
MEIKMRRIWVLALIVALAAPSTPLVAWGATAHRVINRVAVLALPGDLPPFVKRQIDWIGVRSITPDSWRVASEPFLKIDEDPNHGWFREQFAFMREIPRSRYEFVLALYDEFLRIRTSDPQRAALTNVRWTGTLPYAAVETYERIKVAMRGYRAAVAASQDTQFIEMDAAFYIGWLGHYTGDGAMPLHTSIHHDGWQGANPHDYTTDPRVHGRFESQFVDLIALQEGDIAARVTPVKRLTDPFTAILEHLDRSHTRVERVYQLDKAGAYQDRANADARDLVYTCTGEAATLLRDLVYTAWLESALSQQPPGTNTLQPINPKHPQYNPATGSAPAPSVKPAS